MATTTKNDDEFDFDENLFLKSKEQQLGILILHSWA
jgi:hypothetical protein